MKRNIDASILPVNSHVYPSGQYDAGMRPLTLPAIPETLGGRVLELRKYYGMAQKTLAKAAGITQPSLSVIEDDQTTGDNLKASTLIGLSRALKCDAEYLLLGSGDPLQFQLVDIYRKLSEDGRDELLGKANRIYSKEHPGDLSAHPFAPLPKRKQSTKERA